MVFRAGRLFERARLSPLRALGLRVGAGGLAHAAAVAEPAAAPEAAGAAEPVDPVIELLCRAVDPFVLKVPRPSQGPEAVGDDAPGDSPGCTVKYPWNPPSPRTALVGIAGLMLIPGRHDDARSLLLSLLDRFDGGLLPSEFPEDGSAPVYHGADTSLWYVYAVHQYLAYSGEEETVRDRLLPAAWAVIEAYRRGTGLGVGTDADGLLASGAPGVGTTWMDAKVGDWVVTPRHGRAVEINALWYNALCAVAEMSARLAPAEDLANLRQVAQLRSLAGSVREAFNRRFWNESADCCFDVLGYAPDAHDAPGPRDASVRPNQLLAISLPFPVLAPERFAAVVKKVRDELLVPTGVRTLSPKDPAYQGRYRGHVVSRDRAYHNGSAFPFLLGPLVTATVRAGNGSESARAEARLLLEPCLVRLQSAGLGHLCELFDGDAPHASGGALAAPLGVAEVFRCYVEDVLGRRPAVAGEAGAGRVDAMCPCRSHEAEQGQSAPPEVSRPA